MSLPQNLSQFATLVDIIARLRAPDGCPWDRKQTHSSLRESLLEECYEVLEALDEGDSGKLCDEMGDLLMQVVLHAQIATEAGEFKLGDVMNSINTKLIHRHPHIFGSKKVKDAEEVALNWEALKQEERGADTSILASVPKQMPALGYSREIQRRVAQIGFDWEDVDGVIDKLAEEVSEFKQAEREAGVSILDSVPKEMPALSNSQSIQRRVAGVGFDWEDISGVIDKLAEEVNELKQASNQAQRVSEFGDLLFTLANIARRMEIDLETALRETNQRFSRRFTYMEKLCRQRGKNFEELSFDEQNALWEEAKKGLE